MKTRYPSVTEAITYLKKVPREQQLIQIADWREKIGENFVKKVEAGLGR